MNKNKKNNKSDSIVSEVLFEDFCKLCDKIERKRTNNEKKEVIKKFINWWKSKSKPNDNFYPALRLLCPSKDINKFNDNSDAIDGSEGRSAYGFKIDKLRDKYVTVLGLNKKSEDVKKLFDYNKGSHSETKDFASVLYEVMSGRSRKTVGTITLEELHRHLDRIANAYVESRIKDADQVFHQLITNTTALENKWLVRIVLKEMRLGIGDNSILNAYHSDAKEYYETNHNLLKVCVDLSDPEIPLSVKCISLFSSFSPMLSERVKLKSINRFINNKSFYIEVKYDGERFQLHKDSNNYKYFSRNCNDFTESFSISLSPYISDAFGERVKDCILDGEMMGYDNSTDSFVLKTEREFDVKRIKDSETTRHPLFIVFDILYLNGEVLTGKPIKERLEILDSVIKPVNKRLDLAQRTSAQTIEEIIEALNVAIDRREEGIIVKLSDSLYQLNKRQGGGWLKLKPDYIDGLMDELDLLIIGGFYGSRGGISHFLLAVKDSEDNNPERFISITRVGTGYTDEELRDLQKKLENHWKPFDKKKSPNIFQFGRLKPEVWIEPNKSIVLQVKAAEIMQSHGDYGTQYTLRFPRVMRIRDDKEWYECMSYKELQEMGTNGTLANGLNNDDNNEEPDKKRRKLTERPTVSAQHRMADISDVKIQTQIFKDKEFCVLPFTDNKNSLEIMIRENGGKIVCSPFPGKTYCIIATNINPLNHKRYVINKNYDVVKPDWLLKCVEENKLLEWNPNDMWSQTNVTKNRINKFFDRFGDSYTQNIYELELKDMFEKMTDLSGIQLLTNLEIADIEFEYWPNDRSLSFLRTLIVFVDNYETNDQLLVKLVKSELRFYGATLVDTIDGKPSHIVCLSKERVNHFKEINRRNQLKFHIVSQDWIEKCINSQQILDIFDISFN